MCEYQHRSYIFDTMYYKPTSFPDSVYLSASPGLPIWKNYLYPLLSNENVDTIMQSLLTAYVTKSISEDKIKEIVNLLKLTYPSIVDKYSFVE